MGLTSPEALGFGGPGPVLASDGVEPSGFVKLAARKAYSLGGILPRADDAVGLELRCHTDVIGETAIYVKSICYKNDRSASADVYGEIFVGLLTFF